MLTMRDRHSGAQMAAALALLAGIVATIPASGVETAGDARPLRAAPSATGLVVSITCTESSVKSGSFCSGRAPMTSAARASRGAEAIAIGSSPS